MSSMPTLSSLYLAIYLQIKAYSSATMVFKENQVSICKLETKVFTKVVSHAPCTPTFVTWIETM